MNGLALGNTSASSNPHFVEKGAAGDDLHAADLTAIPQTVPRTGRPIQSVSHTGSGRSRDTVEEMAHGSGTGVSVLGERFVVDRDPELGVVLQHPQWSLLGHGRTIAEAERMLLERARELGAILDSDFPFELDSDGLNMRDFLIRLRYLRTIPRR